MAKPHKRPEPRKNDQQPESVANFPQDLATSPIPKTRDPPIAGTMIKSDFSQQVSSHFAVESTIARKMAMAQERQGPQGNDQQLESVVNFPQDRAMSPIQDIRDHLIVARLHNIEYSPLYRIPKELFLIILKQFDLNITADMAAIFCLARVSSLLRRHVLESYKKPDDSYFYHWSICRTVGAQNMTRHLLRKDLLCNTCLSRSDLRMTRTGEVVSRHPRGRSLWNGCKFGGPKVMGIGPLYCSGCAVIHHHRHFSATQRKTKGSERVCIAREGVLRLCEHQQIRWADIERHLVDDHSGKAERWPFIKIPLVTCHSPEHRSCSLDDGGSPSISLSIRQSLGCDLLMISWDAHATIKLNAESRLDSRDARAMFQNHRRAGYLQMHPSLNTDRCNQLPEMGCFGAEACKCLTWSHYDIGEKENHMDSSSNDHRQDDNSRKLPPGYETCLPLQLNEVKNENHSVHGVYLTKSARPADSNWRCLITNYYRVISVGMGTWRDRLRHGSDKKARIIPPHEWLHAVDPDSYQLDDDTSKFGNMWPICKDPSCRNYYRTFQSGICNEYYARTLFDKNYY